MRGTAFSPALSSVTHSFLASSERRGSSALSQLQPVIITCLNMGSLGVFPSVVMSGFLLPLSSGPPDIGQWNNNEKKKNVCELICCRIEPQTFLIISLHSKIFLGREWMPDTPSESIPSAQIVLGVPGRQPREPAGSLEEPVSWGHRAALSPAGRSRSAWLNTWVVSHL